MSALAIMALIELLERKGIVGLRLTSRAFIVTGSPTQYGKSRSDSHLRRALTERDWPQGDYCQE